MGSSMEQTPHYKVIISDRARQMLGNHLLFLAQKSPAAARQLQSDLMHAMRSLHQFPERFPFLDAEFIPHNKYHKLFVKKWYLIFYQIKDQTVYVDYIVDCRQDYRWLVR